MSQSTESGLGIRGDGTAGKWFYSWLLAIGLGLLVGLYGMYRVLTDGTAAFGISNQLPWGILISTYEFFLLMSAGLIIGVVAVALVFGVRQFDPLIKRGTLLSLATLAAGLFAIVIGLGRPERPMIHAVINANPSAPIWWVIMFAGSFAAILVALLVLMESSWVESRLAGSGIGPGQLTRGIGAVGVVVGLAVMVAAGMIFGTAQARPYYGGALAPLYFVLTGVLSGVAAIGFVVGVESKLAGTGMDDERMARVSDAVGKLLAGLVAAALLAALVKAIYGLTSTSESTAMAYEHMLLGSFAPLYWGVGILLGLVVPLALMLYAGTRTPTGVLGASALTLVGLFVTRYEFVIGGQVVALTDDPSHQYPLVSYVPSGVEIALIVFAFALCALVYTIGNLLLDLDTSPHEQQQPQTQSTAEPGGSTNE